MPGMTRRELARRGAVAGAALAFPGLAAEAFAQAPLRQLRRAVRGPVTTPSNSNGILYNQRYGGIKPLAVLVAASANDVEAAVRWAVRNDVPIAARSGGHSYAGYASVRGGLVVDLRRLDRISVSRGRATIGPGAQLIDVYQRLARSGATIPAGSCPSVGVGGHALGGGMGLAGRRFGLTCDNVVSLQIVTANGQLVTASANTNPDLYWACRGGGGGNFGIVTSFKMQTHPVGSASWCLIRWPWASASAALAAWQAFAPQTTARLTSIFTLGTGGSSPTVTALGQYFGSVAQLRALVRPLTAVAGAQLSTGSSSYFALQKRWAGCATESTAACHTRGTAPGGQLPRARFAAKSDYVAQPLASAGRAAMIQAIEARQRQSGSGSLLLDSYGGAINSVAADATAFVHRNVMFGVQELAYFSSGGQSQALGWLQSTHSALRPYTTGAGYQNYIDPTLNNWESAYYGANYNRLVEVKRQYDPNGVFSFAQAIGS